MYHPALAIPLVYNGYDGLEGKTAGNPWISTEDYKAARPEWLERREELSNDFRALMDFQEKHKIGDYYKNKCITLHSVVRAIDWLLDYPYPAPVYWIKGHCYHTDGRRCALYTSHYDAFMKRFGDTADKDSIFYPPPVEGRPPNRVPELLVKEGAQAEWLAKREELTSSFNDFHAWIHRRGITLTNAALGGHAYKRVREVDLMMDYPDPAPMVDREGNHLEGPLAGQRLFLYPSHRKAWEEEQAKRTESAAAAGTKRKAAPKEEEEQAAPKKQKKKKTKKH